MFSWLEEAKSPFTIPHGWREQEALWRAWLRECGGWTLPGAPARDMGGGVRDIAWLLHHLPDTTSLFEVEVSTQTWDEILNFPSFTAKIPPIGKGHPTSHSSSKESMMKFDLWGWTSSPSTRAHLRSIYLLCGAHHQKNLFSSLPFSHFFFKVKFKMLFTKTYLFTLLSVTLGLGLGWNPVFVTCQFCHFFVRFSFLNYKIETAVQIPQGGYKDYRILPCIR